MACSISTASTEGSKKSIQKNVSERAPRGRGHRYREAGRRAKNKIKKSARALGTIGQRCIAAAFFRRRLVFFLFEDDPFSNSPPSNPFPLFKKSHVLHSQAPPTAASSTRATRTPAPPSETPPAAARTRSGTRRPSSRPRSGGKFPARTSGATPSPAASRRSPRRWPGPPPRAGRATPSTRWATRSRLSSSCSGTTPTPGWWSP